MASKDMSDLDQLRQKRMAELQAQHGQGGGAKEHAEQQARQQEMKNNMLSAILDQKARARLNTIAQVKPERAAKLEAMLINMYQRRQIAQGGEKLTDEELLEVLKQVKNAEPKAPTVKYDRRRVNLDSDSD